LITGALLVCFHYCNLLWTMKTAAEWANVICNQVDEEQRPMNYSQAFQLLPDGQGSYYIFNDIFKLVFG
jgi:hypothetical protein